MKVLKSKAENDQLETMEISCTGQGIHNTRTPCGSLLEINALDVHSDFSSDYGGGTDKYYYIICPECGCKTEVFEKNMPQSFKRIIK